MLSTLPQRFARLRGSCSVGTSSSMVEIEIGVMVGQCLDRRILDKAS
jgi:hypothetical protein